MLISFYFENQNDVPRRWSATFTALDANMPRCIANFGQFEYLCKNTSLSGGTIESPNYPNDYGKVVDLFITITVPVGKRIQLNFDEFAVEPLDFINVSLREMCSILLFFHFYFLSYFFNRYMMEEAIFTLNLLLLGPVTQALVLQ